MKRFLAALIISSLAFSMTACTTNTPSGNDNPPPASEAAPSEEPEGTEDVADEPEESTGGEFKVAMITDVGGVNDQSFNQSAWEGLLEFESDGLGGVSYLESHQDADYAPNIDTKVDEGNNLIWGIGFMMQDAIMNAAEINPDQMFAIVDGSYEESPSNLIGVMFKAHEPSFLVGYMAGKTTETNKVGFIGGIESEIIQQFEYGYLAGVTMAAKELDKEIEVVRQYANSFSDDAAGKAIANQMYTNGCDIIFHAAGNVGQGVIKAAEEANKLVIGVDRDQSASAPDNVMTSALKNVGTAMYDVSEKLANGENIGGTTEWLGIKEGACGIPPYEGSTEKLVEKQVYDDTIAVEDKIKSGEITVPSNQSEFEAFEATLG